MISSTDEIFEQSEENLKKYKDVLKQVLQTVKEDLIDALEDEKAVLEGMSTILEKHHSVTNEIADAQHELNKELQTSLTNYQYLDKETRKLLFNEEDYLKLNKQLENSQKRINELQKDYNREIVGKTQEQIELITNEYERQYDLEMKKYEIAKADLEVTKKKQELQNTLNERNTQMFINGQWTWVADTDAIISAQEALFDAQKEEDDAERDLSQTKEMQALERSIDAIESKINDIEKSFEDFEDSLKAADGALIETAKSMIKGGYSFKKAMKELLDEKGERASSGFGPISNFEADKFRPVSVGKDGSGVIWVPNTTSEYATGTSSAKPGLAQVIEQGSELLATKEGFLYEMSGGEMVFNNDQFRFLYEFSKTPINKMLNGLTHNDNSSVDNSITINGISIDAKSQEGEALKDILTRILGNR